ncbi:GPW/gp25 family protein [Tumebacillus sp. DT12]|uniref:GPW/gp25 family protein n=1 Tax=Tumebacillus lacus TaxID=2995335 RepID=A0ABT3X3S7_9BACL|nr:GPW/gp25 family protein [Tumebacillus lacus]MCX7570276.1 GPW/gp25 family protein [Tumebacillus lacus]
MGESFLGRGWKFPVQVDKTTGRVRMSEGEEDIAEAIKVLIWTAKGERVMRPTFGCGIHDFVFDNTDETTLRLMESAIEDAILQWEPRVHETEVEIHRDLNTPGKLAISVSYRVRTTNNLFNQVYPFYLQEGAQ